MNSITLEKFLQQQTTFIHNDMVRRFSDMPATPYLGFLLNSRKGRDALRRWVNEVTNLLVVDPRDFFEFQTQVGFERAMQGFRLEDVFVVYLTFNEILWHLIQEASRDDEVITFREYKKFRDFYELLFQGYTHVAASIIKTREESITEKITELNALHEFTRNIINFYDLKDVAEIILRKARFLFGVEHSLLALQRNNRSLGIESYPKIDPNDAIELMINETFKRNKVMFMDLEGQMVDDIDQFELKQAVAVPIETHGTCYGVLALINNTDGFRFSGNELSVLYQYFYIIAVSLESVFMLEEIESSRKELRLLTGKIITIREEEQKRLAGDIHDTLAQSLAGISYKIQFCKELAKKNPEVVIEHLDNLIATVDTTIDRTKYLISNLRPPLFDIMGLIPALKRYIRNFVDRTNIEVHADLPKHVDLSSEKNICIFRVIQEALSNIYKHAQTDRADVILKVGDDQVSLTVKDNGKGFDTSIGSTWMITNNMLGLLYMKERVESIGGKRTITSKKNEGCRIEVRIPLDTEGQAHE